MAEHDPDAAHPAETYDRPVADLARRGKHAVVALGLTMLLHVLDLGTRLVSISALRDYQAAEGDEVVQSFIQPRLESADTLVNGAVFAGYVLLLATAICFLRWVRQLVVLTRVLGGRGVPWTPKQATWAFILPAVSLWRPYQVLRDVQRALDPEKLLPPEIRLDREGAGDYRSAAFVSPPLAEALPNAFLGVWWGLFVGMNVVSRVVRSATEHAQSAGAVVSAYQGEVALDLLAIVAALFAVRVVRGLTARLGERFRRIRHATPESLARQGVVLG